MTADEAKVIVFDLLDAARVFDRSPLGFERMDARDHYERMLEKVIELVAQPGAEAEVERLRTSLQNILEARDDNQPAALNMPDLEYARSIIRIIHREARAALGPSSSLTSKEP